MARILWLPSWYPSSLDPYPGDFIERQARAAARFQPLMVLCLQSDLRRTRKDGIKVERSEEPNLITYTGYIPRFRDIRTWFGWIRKALYYLWSWNKLFRLLIREQGKPDLVHVQVTLKAGIFALYLKWFRAYPFILTEHWSYFLREPERKNSFLVWSEGLIIRTILRNARYLLPVSANLDHALRRLAPSVPSRVIYNTVDTSLFFYVPRSGRNPLRMIHVSSLIDLKNPVGILRAFEAVTEDMPGWELWMVGPYSPSLLALARQSGLLDRRVFFSGLVPYCEVARQVRNSDLMVLFSFLETNPCSVLEGLCCGLPVLATPVGIMPQILGEENGLFVEAGNEARLAQAMRVMGASLASYDREAIARKAASLFQMDQIGSQIHSVYRSLLP